MGKPAPALACPSYMIGNGKKRGKNSSAISARRKEEEEERAQKKREAVLLMKTIGKERSAEAARLKQTEEFQKLANDGILITRAHMRCEGPGSSALSPLEKEFIHVVVANFQRNPDGETFARELEPMPGSKQVMKHVILAVRNGATVDFRVASTLIGKLDVYNIQAVICLFDRCVIHAVADEIMHMQFQHIARRHDCFEDIYEKYKLEWKSLNDKLVFETMICIAAQAGRTEDAEAVFQDALRSRVATECAYARSMQAAMVAGNYKLALSRKKEAKSLNLLGVAAMDVLMQHFSDTGELDDARATFDRLDAEKQLEARVLHSYIRLCGRLNKMEEAERAYSIATTMAKHSSMEWIVYSAYIEAQLLDGNLEEAARLFDEARFDFDDRAVEYDLHGGNFGDTIMHCYRAFRPGRLISLIVGRGSHSRGLSVVRQAVWEFCMAHGVKVKAPHHNAGHWICEAPMDYAPRPMVIRYSFESSNPGYEVLHDDTSPKPADPSPSARSDASIPSFAGCGDGAGAIGMVDSEAECVFVERIP